MRRLSSPGLAFPGSPGPATPLRRARAVLTSATIAIVLAAAAASPAAAAHRVTSTVTGNDISWPQCGKTFPSGQAFGIVGVNGGLANKVNPCLGPDNGGVSTSELAWAWGSTGASKLPWKVALYVNTADPSPLVADWPKSNVVPGIGPCDGSDSPECAWQYGWERATQDMAWLSAAATQVGVTGKASDYPWWLDVETANSWETGSLGLANNVADLQGMVAAFEGAGATVGIYSTSYQWGVITGGSTDGNLAGLADWIPGARTLSAAQANCSLAGFTGAVTITQWFGKPFDGDWAC